MQKETAVPGRVNLVDPYEARLVQRAQERSPEAWDEIYTRYYPQIYRYVHARVFDATTAEDLASTVFLGAVKGIRTFRYEGQPLLAWLYRIARNVVSSHQRTMFRQKTVSLSSMLDLPGRLLGQTTQAPRADGDNVNAGSSVEPLDLREAITKLPQAQREVIVLKFFVGLDAKEIASLVGKEPAAVYSLQARALDGLKKRLVDAR